jgi:hypothetical protein
VNGDLNPQPFEEWAMSATAWATGLAAFQSPKLFSSRAGRQAGMRQTDSNKATFVFGLSSHGTF